MSSDAEPLPDASQMLQDILDRRGWSAREGQTEMVNEIVYTLDKGEYNGGTVISAPVGTGKSLAYSVAGVSSGKRTIICTSTKALQNQLIDHDLPDLAEDLKELYGYDLKYAVLKGRSNYLCMTSAKYHLGKMTGESDGDPMDDDLFDDIGTSVFPETVQMLKSMVGATQTAMEDGLNSGLAQDDELRKLPWQIRREVFADRKCPNRTANWAAEVDEEDEIYGEAPRVDLESESCTTPCAYRKAYADAARADIVVINTSLLAAEMNRSRVAKDPIQSPLQLAQAGLVVVDEAQHMDRILMDSFSVELDFEDVYSNIEAAHDKIVKRRKSMEDRLSSWESMLDDAYDDLNDVIEDKSIKNSDLLGRVSSELEGIAESLRNTFSVIKRKGDDAPSESTLKTMNSMFSYLEEDVIDKIEEVAGAIHLKTEDINGRKEDVYDVKFQGEGDEFLRISAVPISLSFVRSQLSEATSLSNEPFSSVTPGMTFTPVDSLDPGALVMCSGTITEEEGHYIGLHGDYAKVASPFDPARSRLLLPQPQLIPSPYDDDWLEKSWDAAKQAIVAAGGRTLFLTTSYNNLERFYELAQQDEDLNKLGITMISQDREGTQTRQELVNTFKEDETSVLFGTTSFWEGVNVPGPACSLVIMDKIMFPYRDNPIVAAKRRYVEKTGSPEKVFDRVDVSWAATMLAQGAGRLIRAESDIGGIMILDSRLMEKSYGASLLKLLPTEMLRTSSLEAFIEWMEFVKESPDAEQLPEEDRVIWRPIKPRRPKRRKR